MKIQSLVSIFTCLILIFSAVPDTVAAEGTFPKKTTIQLKLEEEAKAAEKAKAEDGVVDKTEAKQVIDVEKLNLPKDTSSVFAIKELQIRGNALISTDEILGDMPLVYNASDEVADKAAPADLYDLRAIHNLIANPGQPWDVSRRAMQGLTQHILSVYQDKGYAGIYVYISAKAGLDGAELQDGILPIDVVEAKVSEIETITYNSEGQKVEKGFLRNSALQKWSPIKIGQVAKKKKLDNFVNLLNLNPDRHVYAIISRGSEPNTLALEYNVYEANPWHFYIQVDNSGSKERQWAPRVGIVNTNLFCQLHFLFINIYAYYLTTIRFKYLYGYKSK